MTTAEAIAYCTILQDKYGSPNVVDSEWLDYLNHAINEYIHRCLPDNQGGVVNYENDKNIEANLRPLIYLLPTMTTTAGVLADATIDAALVTASGDSAATHMRIMSIAAGSVGYPVKFVRHNNFWRFNRNYFKAASATAPQYTDTSTGYPVSPVNNSIPLVVTVLKRPSVLDLVGQDPELENDVMYVIIAIALQLSGVTTRDQELIQDVRNITLQGK